MLTKILFAVMFGVGGWFLAVNYPPGASELQHIQYSQYVLFIMCGTGAGFIIGHKVAKLLAKNLPYRYKQTKDKIYLLPFPFDKNIYLLIGGDGYVRYVYGEFLGIKLLCGKRKDFSLIRVEKNECLPYCAPCLPVRATFFGLFADFSSFVEPKMALVVPKSTMIMEGDLTQLMKHPFMM